MFRSVAKHNVPQPLIEFEQQRGLFKPGAGTPLDQVQQSKEVVVILDDAARSTPGAAAKYGGARSLTLEKIRSR
jgi:hypothetical protein